MNIAQEIIKHCNNYFVYIICSSGSFVSFNINTSIYTTTRYTRKCIAPPTINEVKKYMPGSRLLELIVKLNYNYYDSKIIRYILAKPQRPYYLCNQFIALLITYNLLQILYINKIKGCKRSEIEAGCYKSYLVLQNPKQNSIETSTTKVHIKLNLAIATTD